MTAAPRPGWYADPSGVPTSGTGVGFRWWDGSGWTDAIGDSAQAPAPEAAHHTRRGYRRRASRLRTALILSVGFTVFVAVSVGAGMWLWREPTATGVLAPAQPREPSASAPSDSADPMGHLDLESRWASIGPATMQLPDRPYVATPDPLKVAGLFDVLFLASAPVHQRYDGRRSWSSAVLLARLSATLGPGDDLEAEARTALTMFSRTLFGNLDTQLTDLTWSDHAVSGFPGLLVTGRVDYAVTRLPSRHDDVTAMLVRLDDGSVVMAVSSVPNDAAPQITTAARAALGSLVIG